jgi:hypothetical protein
MHRRPIFALYRQAGLFKFGHAASRTLDRESQRNVVCHNLFKVTPQSSRLAEFGGRGMSFNICRGTDGDHFVL